MLGVVGIILSLVLLMHRAYRGISVFRKLSQEVMAEEARKDAMAQTVHQAYLTFAEITDNWDLVSERAYYDFVATEPHRLRRWMFPPAPY